MLKRLVGTLLSYCITSEKKTIVIEIITTPFKTYSKSNKTTNCSKSVESG